MGRQPPAKDRMVSQREDSYERAKAAVATEHAKELELLNNALRESMNYRNSAEQRVAELEKEVARLRPLNIDALKPTSARSPTTSPRRSTTT